jgi:hypothetical protein
MGVELFSSNSNLLMAWLYCLIFTAGTAFLAGLFPVRLERLRASALLIMIFPGLVFALVYAFRGFGVLERPLVHWVFDKAEPEALHLGLVFDPLSFSAVLFTGASMIALCFRNRPSIRMSAALALSWVGLGLAVSSQTLWLAAFGIGIQLFSRTFPIVETGESTDGEDGRWIASTQRAWIGLLCVLCGAAGLAARGIRLDFFSDTAWTNLESGPTTWVAGGILVFGLLVIAAPAFASNALFSPLKQDAEENVFVSETSLSWIAVIIFFRVLSNLHETPWLLAVGIGAAVATAASIAALTFQTSKSSAIHLWLSTLPVTTLMVLPFLSPRETSLFIVGSMLAGNGLWLALDHRRSRLEIAAAAVFFLSAIGFAGWSTAAGFSSFFSRFDGDPALKAAIFFLFLLYMSLGWRLVLRGGDRHEGRPAIGKWIVLGLLFVVGFGPLLSGRWGGGAIPGEPDWIEGAKAWGWIKPAVAESLDSDWTGFGISQGLVLVSALLGIFAWRSATLYPFAEKYPKGARAAQGLFGLLRLQEALFHFVKQAGRLGVEKVSQPVWERALPFVVERLFSGFRRIGSYSEKTTDALTSDGYGRAIAPAAKLVQWLHGGNVRLYAWFTLIWILIFSIYLTR